MKRGMAPWTVVITAVALAVATLPVAASQEVILKGGDDTYVIRADEDNDWIWVEEGEESEHAWLGVVIQNPSADVRKKHNVSDDVDGVIVTETSEDGPAEKAGIKPGDVILGIEDDEIDDINELVEAVVSREPGDEIEITLWRDGRTMTVEATLGAKKGQKYRHAYDIAEALKAIGQIDMFIPQLSLGIHGGGKGRLGVYVDEVEGDLAEYFEIPDGEGVLVEGVVEDSPAEKAGIKAGDIILEIDGETIADIDDLTDEISDMKTDAETPIVILRKGQRKTLSAVVGESAEEKIAKVYQENLKFLSRDKDGLIGTIDINLEREELEEVIQELQEEMDELKKELEELRAEE